MKRWLVGFAIALLMVSGTAYAASTMAVKINGNPVTFKTAPKFEDNTLMVPLEEVVAALGIDAKWDVATNTLEITDNRVKQISDLRAQLQQLQTTNPTKPASAADGPTKETISKYLQDNFGKFSSDSKTFGVTWSHFTATDGSELFSATMASSDFLSYLDLRIAGKGDDISTWFEGAAKVIAKVYPSSSAVLMYTGIYSSYPTAKHDSVSLTSDFKWRVTDYELWAFVTDGSVRMSWDDK